MNLDSIKNIYIIGIEGAGTSALACILKAQGKNVAGSDEGNHFYWDVLKKKNIKVFHKFSKNNLKEAFGNKNKIDLVIYSTSILPEQNEELKYIIEDKTSHLKALNYSQALGVIFNTSKFGIAVCGTHGKTTTTAMLATAMKAVGADPTALVGSKVFGWDGGILIGNSDYFIIEADEYQNKLQYYKPKAVILTSADYDHPDFFKTEEEYKQVFKDFVARIPKDGFLVAYAGDKNVVEISKSAQCKVIFYDIDTNGTKKIRGSKAWLSECSNSETKSLAFSERTNKGTVPNSHKRLQNLNLILPGQHNLLNATATLKVIQKLGLNEQKAKIALGNFKGTARRFEIKGKYNGATIIDDYAHHPVEVQATLQAAKEKYPNKNIKCIFHPHTFTRTEALLDNFAKSFTDADEIYLLDIFGSAREKQGGVNSDDLVDAIKVYDKNKTIKNLHTISEATKYFQQNLQPNSILITMGAGDVYLVGERLMKKFNNK